LLPTDPSRAGIASSKHGNIRKFCLSLESLTHLHERYHMCWTWLSVTCAYDILARAEHLLPVEQILILSASVEWAHPCGFGFARVGLSFSYFSRGGRLHALRVPLPLPGQATQRSLCRRRHHSFFSPFSTHFHSRIKLTTPAQLLLTLRLAPTPFESALSVRMNQSVTSKSIDKW
jgi:hypothetical protein